MKVSEIFYSLQGEGKNQGKACLFIRCAGCNLDCRWCDTKDSRSGGMEMDTSAIQNEVSRINPRLVCITGGEPLLQAEALKPLLASLHDNGIEIDIETNGTIDFTSLQPYASICMDVKCPSSGAESDLSLLGTIRPEDTVKFVVADEHDCRYAQEVMQAYPIRGEIFFSPVNTADRDPIVRFILKNSLPVRFQIQLHKILGVK